MFSRLSHSSTASSMDVATMRHPIDQTSASAKAAMAVRLPMNLEIDMARFFS
jgi:hypothetical protein